MEVQWPCIARREKAKQSRENGNLPVVAALLCVRNEAVPQHPENTAQGEWEREISQPMAELWQQLRPEHTFTIEFSWHAASKVFSPRTPRKNQGGFNNFQSGKKGDITMAFHCFIGLWKKEKNFFWSHARRTMSGSHCESKTHAKGTGNQTCFSSFQAGHRGSVQVGAYTYCLILPGNVFQLAHPIHSGVEYVCSDAVLSLPWFIPVKSLVRT